MDESHGDTKARVKKAPLTRVTSEQVVGASANGRHSSDSSKHRHGSHMSGKESQDDNKSSKKSHHHRSVKDGTESGSHVNGIKRQSSKDNIERRPSASLNANSHQQPIDDTHAASSSPKTIRRSASVKDISLSGRESPARAMVRGYEFSMTDDQKKFINETIPRLRENDPNITSVITNKNLPSESFADFAIAMVVNKKVNTLDMSDSLYSVPISVHIAKILHENRTIRELNANGNTLRTEGIKKIAPELGINNILTRLFLRNNLIDDEGAISIFENLQEKAVLQILDLGKNNLSHQCLPVLIRAMKTNHTLQALILDGTNIGDEGMIHLAEAFLPSTNTSLKMLSLQDAQVGPKGFSTFAAVMQTHQSLSKLLLRGNKIKVDRTAAENMFKLASLQELDLSANLLGEEGVSILAQGFHKNTSLLHLNLSETLPTTTTSEPLQAIKSLAEVLAMNHSLHTLKLAKNGLQDESITLLMEALSLGKSALQAIDLSGNRCTNKGAERIAAMLKYNTQLHEMDLSENKIMLAGAKLIIDALKHNRTLRKLIFTNASIEPALPQAALEMLKQNFVIQKCVLQKKDETKIASRLKKPIKAELKYNTKMNFYSYNIKYSRLLKKLSVLQDIKASDYIDFQQFIADYFSQTRKIMKFLTSERANKSTNKQQVVKDIVQENLSTIFKLLNETPDIFNVYTNATDKMQTTYEKLIRDVPAITPAKPLTFPKPPAPMSTIVHAAVETNGTQAMPQSIQPPSNLDKQAEHAIPSQITDEASLQHLSDAANLSAVVSPRVTSTSFQLLSGMDLSISMAVEVPQAVDTTIQRSNNVPPISPLANSQNSEIVDHKATEVPLVIRITEADSHIGTDVTAMPTPPASSSAEAILSAPPVKGVDQAPLNNHEISVKEFDGDDLSGEGHDTKASLNLTQPAATVAVLALNVDCDSAPATLNVTESPHDQHPTEPAVQPHATNDDTDNDSSDDSTSSSSSDSSDASETSIISALGDHSTSGSRRSLSSSRQFSFQRPDPSVVPPLELPDSDEEDGGQARRVKTLLKAKSASLVLPAAANNSCQNLSLHAASSAFFKPASDKDKLNLIDENKLSELQTFAEDLLVKFIGLLMASIIQKNVINNDNKVLLRKFEQQMGDFLCKLFYEFKGNDAPEKQIRAFITIHNMFKLDDQHIHELVNIIEIINAQRFSLLSPHSKNLLNKIFTPEIIECLRTEDEEDLKTVQSKGEKEDGLFREPRPRLVFFNFLRAKIFEHTLHLFSKCQWASSGKAEPIQQNSEVPKKESPKSTGCMIC